MRRAAVLQCTITQTCVAKWSRWLNPIQVVRRITRFSAPSAVALLKGSLIAADERGYTCWPPRGKMKPKRSSGVTRRAAMKTALAAPVAAQTPRSDGKSIETENRKPGASDWQLTNVQ